MAEPTPKAFVCGHPIAHSRSPIIHRYWLKTYGIAGSYDPIDVAPADFSAFVASLRQNGLAGGNVTIPHKEAAYAAVTRRTGAAEAIGAVNTLWHDGAALVGGNTDAEGFAANLDEYAPEWTKAGVALVLGAGGAARAVIDALQQRGLRDIRIVNRTRERAVELADRFGGGTSAHGLDAADELAGDAGLVVNTTALGMHGETDIPVDPARLPDHAIVTDIVYVPLETPLLAAARLRGLKTVDGLGMLLHQAAPGFERWFGVRPTVTAELRALVMADLGAKP